jgi:hypothetical protein
VRLTGFSADKSVTGLEPGRNWAHIQCMAQNGHGWIKAFSGAVLSLPLFIGVATPVSAEDASEWLPPGSTIESTLAERPARWIEAEMAGGRMGYLARLGELVFRSPLTLGRDAARKGLSCDACHPNGAANTQFFITGVSNIPGTVDVTHAAFHYREDDGVHNPVDIPSLRGVRLTAPYGRDGRFADLRQFSRNVVMQEFGGPEPEEWQLDAMVAYMNQLALPQNSKLNALGQAAYNQHCVYCHAGPNDLVQGHRWDVGTGGYFEAPPLRALAETAPYLHNGSAPTVRDAMLRHVDHVTNGPITADAAADILNYLDNFGAVDRAFDPETLRSETERLKGFIDLLNQSLLDEDAVRTDVVADMIAVEIGRIYERFSEPAGKARGAITEWAKALKRSVSKAREANFPAARTDLRNLKLAIDADMPAIRSEIGLSLFAATEPK